MYVAFFKKNTYLLWIVNWIDLIFCFVWLWPCRNSLLHALYTISAILELKIWNNPFRNIFLKIWTVERSNFIWQKPVHPLIVLYIYIGISGEWLTANFLFCLTAGMNIWGMKQGSITVLLRFNHSFERCHQTFYRVCHKSANAKITGLLVRALIIHFHYFSIFFFLNCIKLNKHRRCHFISRIQLVFYFTNVMF